METDLDLGEVQDLLSSSTTDGMISSIAKRYPVLTAEEESELCERLKDDRPQLEKLLVYHNVKLAVMLTGHYTEKSETREDFVMMGLQGLVMAARTFDPGLGKRFSSFAGNYVKVATRHLFDKNLAAPKAQNATQIVFDKPVEMHKSKDDGDAPAAGDTLYEQRRDPNFNVITQEDRARRERSVRDMRALADHVCATALATCTPRMREIAHAVIIGGRQDRVAERLGVSRQLVSLYVDKASDAIRRYIRDVGDPDLEEYFGGAVGARRNPDVADAESVSVFLRSNGILVLDEEEGEPEDRRRERFMQEFDRAAQHHITATGAATDVDVRISRKVFEESVACRKRITKVAKELGIPQTYAEFLRDKAFRIFSSGRDIASGPVVPGDSDSVSEVAATHEMKDRMTFVNDPSGFKSISQTANAIQKMGLKGQGRRKRKNWITVRAPYRGNFYSQEAYDRFSLKKRKGISVRELEMHIRLGNIPKLSPAALERKISRISVDGTL